MTERSGTELAYFVSMLIATKILVATDFSDASDTAWRYGRELARLLSATLHVLHVAGDITATGMLPPTYVPEFGNAQEGIVQASRTRLAELIRTESDRGSVTSEVTRSRGPVRTRSPGGSPARSPDFGNHPRDRPLREGPSTVRHVHAATRPWRSWTARKPTHSRSCTGISVAAGCTRRRPRRCRCAAPASVYCLIPFLLVTLCRLIVWWLRAGLRFGIVMFDSVARMAVRLSAMDHASSARSSAAVRW